ncbi:cytochrome c oxidase subunit 4 [Haematomicrobium sanguinis]|uniref:cytochrome c oxidase subunit 4 n=1 Tax=Haematomicrobium sanguinis TaxID=479106 RepID=UPI00047BC96A|nr:cytochrome c oxidase subunit 4 [Haematomicrobium sanguinis]
MKFEARLFYLGLPFFVPVVFIYGFMTNWNEWVGIMGIALVAGLAAMIGFYLNLTAKRVGPRPEDRLDGDIAEGAGPQGHFSPWSWWPIVMAASCAGLFLGLAVGFWISMISVVFGVIALVGWTFEYSRGDHAH